MGSAVRLDLRLPQAVHIVTALPSSGEAVRILRAAEMLVIDGIDWQADLAVIRAGLVKERRAPAEPFGGERATTPVQEEVAALARHADNLRAELYPFACTAHDVMFRPMRCGPEPLHFDTFDDSAGSWLSAFINVAATPRKYRLGASLPNLERGAVREVLKACTKPGEFSYRLRQRTAAGLPPLDAAAPRHELDLAPGAIWFFNSKTVSHELLHGEGAVSLGWCLPGAAPVQSEVVRSLLR